MGRTPLTKFSGAFSSVASNGATFALSVMPGLPELFVILLIVLVVFGANKLPGIGDALGRSIRNFKKASSNDDDDKKLEASGNGKELEAGGPKAKELAAGKEDDGEWEEVVVRRKKQKS